MCSIIQNTADPPEDIPYCWDETCSLEDSNECINKNFNSACVVLIVDAQEQECFEPGCDTDDECVTNMCYIDPQDAKDGTYPIPDNGSTKAGICYDCTETGDHACAEGFICQNNGGPYNGVCRLPCTSDNGVCSSWETCDLESQLCTQNDCDTWEDCDSMVCQNRLCTQCVPGWTEDLIAKCPVAPFYEL